MNSNNKPKKRNIAKTTKIVSIFVGIIGVFLMVIGVGSYFTQQIPSDWVRVNGTVVGFQEIASIRHPQSTSPIYQFTVNGQSYRVQGSVHHYKWQLPEMGEGKPIAYPANNPNQARVVNNLGWALWALSGLGVFVFVLAVYLYRKAKTLKA